MLFKDIKIGDTLYFYDRTSIELSTKKVAKVSAPYLDNNVMVGMVVDVSVGEKRYKFRESAEVGFDGDCLTPCQRRRDNRAEMAAGHTFLKGVGTWRGYRASWQVQPLGVVHGHEHDAQRPLSFPSEVGRGESRHGRPDVL